MAMPAVICLTMIKVKVNKFTGIIYFFIQTADF